MKKQTAPKRQNHKPNQPHKQIHAESTLESSQYQQNRLASDQEEAQQNRSLSVTSWKKCLQHQWDLLHNFTDFKKANDIVWHKELWHVIQKYNIKEGNQRTTQKIFVNEIQLEEVSLGVIFSKDCRHLHHDQKGNSTNGRLDKIWQIKPSSLLPGTNCTSPS